MDNTKFSALILPLPRLISTIFESEDFNFQKHKRQDTKDSFSLRTGEVGLSRTPRARNPTRAPDHRLSGQDCEMATRHTCRLLFKINYFTFFFLFPDIQK